MLTYTLVAVQHEGIIYRNKSIVTTILWKFLIKLFLQIFLVSYSNNLFKRKMPLFYVLIPRIRMSDNMDQESEKKAL